MGAWNTSALGAQRPAEAQEDSDGLRTFVAAQHGCPKSVLKGSSNVQADLRILHVATCVVINDRISTFDHAMLLQRVYAMPASSMCQRG